MEPNLVLVNNLVPPIATHLSSLSPPCRSKIHFLRLGFQPRNSCSGRPTASRPPNAWLLTLPSLKTRRYVQDIIFLYKIVSGLVDCPDLLDKIVFHVIKSLVFFIVVRFKWLQTVISCCDLNQNCLSVSLCQQIAALKNTNTALKQWNNTVSCILLQQDSANSFMKQIIMIVSSFLLWNF